MSTVCVRRDIDVPSGDLPAIVEQLSELSYREFRVGAPPDGDWTLDYTAAMDVFDVGKDGRVVVTWTATIRVLDTRTDVVQTLRDAVFRDFIDQLRREVCARPRVSRTIGAKAVKRV